MIEVHQLSKTFGKLEVLKNVNLQFRYGECVALIGPNGCGKTTLIKTILGMVVPDSGQVFVNGKNIERDFNYRKDIGYMPQIGRYPEQMNIRQVMDMLVELRGKDSENNLSLFKAYQLETMMDKRMRTLSGGTTQKVSAMLAFLFQPSIYILDEPTAGLDPVASEILKDKIMEEKNNGRLILITSHLLNELDDLITHIIFMQDGSVLFHKPVQELLEQTNELKLSKAIAHYLKKESYA